MGPKVKKELKSIIKEEQSPGSSKPCQEAYELHSGYTSVKTENKATKRKKDCPIGKSKKVKVEIDFEKKEVKTKNVAKRTKTISKVQLHLSDHQLLSEEEALDLPIAENLVRLFEDDNTIPFIARYRKEMTGSMDPASLRKAKEAYDRVQQLKSKLAAVVKTLSSQNVLDEELSQRLSRVHNLGELEVIAASFKSAKGQGTLANRARKLGLAVSADSLLHGTQQVVIENLIKPETKGLDTRDKVLQGLQHIVADIISKDSEVLAQLNILKSREYLTLESSKRQEGEDSDGKYKLYYDFSCPIKHIKQHQVLAINRGELLKVLSVKIIVPSQLWEKVKGFCVNQWLKKGMQSPVRRKLFHDSLEDAIQRLMSPALERNVRAKLKEEAERAAIEVFAKNLKQLLLTRPYRGKTVMAIDPGFKQGCKVAVVAPDGLVLAVRKFFLPGDPDDVVRSLLLAHKCESIALGNGKGSKEAEAFLAEKISRGHFAPLDVAYTVVDEQGVSIYSCSQLASEEFPGLDPTLVSAVSLARRLQDPLGELLKVEPQHLGVGMYQLDLPEKKLVMTLNEVVSECVSFVGVDVNTASVYLLKRVAGLNATKAENIIGWRMEKGPVLERKQLAKVKGIGAKTFQQCAGFLRIIPSTAGCEETKLNPLDRTWIHPESYDTAYRVMKLLKVEVNQLGSRGFIAAVTAGVTAAGGVAKLAAACSIAPANVELIVEALSRSLDHDLRSLSEIPLFRRTTVTLDTMRPGDTLPGVVRNVVAFGAFVDVGGGVTGLIHSSKMAGRQLNLGDNVSVRVLSVEVATRRLGLHLVTLLSNNQTSL